VIRVRLIRAASRSADPESVLRRRHDPTHLNRQGNDIGRQYRSAVFYADEDQRRVAQSYIQQLDEAKVFGRRSSTTLEPLEQFFEAEDYHQNFVGEKPAPALRGRRRAARR
jgi:methionine-S-sulfoxide reductase